ncbi:MAG: carbohydrate ABC transporter permease [Trueperaceae bacterium]|nr:carbohydrate ABC transporter permease [Trueperaceae bacterium]
MKNRMSVPGIAGTVFTIFMALVWIFPIYWAIVTSLKLESKTMTNPPQWIPIPLTFANYTRVLGESGLFRWYFNSFFTSIITTFLVIVLCALCGFAISQLSFPGKNLLYWLLLAGFMIPGQALIVPLFSMLADFGWVNSYQGLILPQVIAVINIIIYKQFFDSVPVELRDSAIIDGASTLRIFRSIYMPLNMGITWALAIVTFIGIWNNFFWPFLITTSESMMTIPVGITQVTDSFGVQYARTMAMAVLAGLPVVAGYLIFQKRVTEGIMMTAGLKG